jgi:pimeloyl-ACP methyl ester carboxylesterase
METFDGSESRLEFDDCVLRAPGMTATVEVTKPSTTSRGTGPALRDWISRAVTAAALRQTHQIVIEQASPTADAEQTAVEIELPCLGEGYNRVLLSQDEGVYSWVIETEQSSRPAPTARGGGSVVYTVPVIAARRPATGTQSKRGVIAQIFDKIVHVFEFAFREQLGAAARGLARDWETKQRSYRLRSFTPEDYQSSVPQVPHIQSFEAFQGRCLLFIHGTFSRAASGFGDIAPDVFRQLYERYNRRVMAFDHFTLSDDPVANAEQLAKYLNGTKLEVDIVCHSRGGLLAREIVLRVPSLKVRRIAFVGAPNAGTILAKPERMIDFISTYTNSIGGVVERFGEPVVARVADIVEAIVHAVKHLAASGLRGLPGLQAMNPGGDYLTQLSNHELAGIKCFGIASDYEPARLQLKAWLATLVVDQIFDQSANDLVVPCKGAFALLPEMSDTLQLPRSAGVHHCDYFSHREVTERLLEWLPG